ncbi:MAG: Hydrogenase-4 component A [Firmicutes bacterium]|nr:Hydrogenase-4 component A [Bacillota bacterium]
MTLKSERLALAIDDHRCTGCMTCVMVCSFAHEQIFSYERSRIRVWKDEDQGLCIPIVCEHCKDAPCIEVCPTGAMQHDSDSSVQLNALKCIGCRECTIVCPFGAISFNAEGDLIKCDFCKEISEEPLCALYCTAEALRLVSEKRIARKRIEETAHRRLAAMVKEE